MSHSPSLHRKKLLQGAGPYGAVSKHGRPPLLFVIVGSTRIKSSKGESKGVTVAVYLDVEARVDPRVRGANAEETEIQ